MNKSVIAVAGNFYQAQNKSGDYFFGTKEKAEAFAKGKHEPVYAPLVVDGVLASAPAQS